MEFDIAIESPAARLAPPLNVGSDTTAVPRYQPTSVFRVRLVMLLVPAAAPVTVKVAVGGMGGFSAGNVYVTVVPPVDGDFPLRL